MADRYAKFDDDFAEKDPLALVHRFAGPSRPPAGLAARVALCVNVVRPAWPWLASNTRSARRRLEPVALDRLGLAARRAGSRPATGCSASTRRRRRRQAGGAGRAASLEPAGWERGGDRVVVVVGMVIVVVPLFMGWQGRPASPN